MAPEGVATFCEIPHLTLMLSVQLIHSMAMAGLGVGLEMAYKAVARGCLFVVGGIRPRGLIAQLEALNHVIDVLPLEVFALMLDTSFIVLTLPDLSTQLVRDHFCLLYLGSGYRRPGPNPLHHFLHL